MDKEILDPEDYIDIQNIHNQLKKTDSKVWLHC